MKNYQNAFRVLLALNFIAEKCVEIPLDSNNALFMMQQETMYKTLFTLIKDGLKEGISDSEVSNLDIS
jgi:hypothetical protein